MVATVQIIETLKKFGKSSFKSKKLESLRHFVTIPKILIYYDFAHFPVDFLAICIIPHRYVFSV